MTIAPKFLLGNSTGQSAINFIEQPHLQADTIDQPCFQANIRRMMVYYLHLSNNFLW